MPAPPAPCTPPAPAPSPSPSPPALPDLPARVKARLDQLRADLANPPAAFACDVEMARTVRRYARDRVTAGGRGTLADEAETVTAELFSNAVFAQMHARITTVIPVQCLVQGLMVIIDVYDHAPGRPEFKAADVWAETGRGLQMVRSLTNGAIGWAPWGTGKVVSAMLGGLPQAPAARAFPSFRAGSRKAAPGE